MSLRGLLVLVVVLAAVAIALVRLRGAKEDAPAAPEDVPLVAAFSADAVRSIRISCADAAYTLVRGPGGGWTVEAPARAEADPREVRRLLTAVSGARVRKTVAPAGTEGGAFGLAGEACTVSLALDGDAAGRTLTLGRSSPVGYDRYARAGDGRVVLVDGSLHSAVARPADAFRERRLLPVEPDAVARLTIERPDGSVALARGGAGWTLEAPVRDRADAFEADRAVRAATSLEIDDARDVRLPEAKASRRIAIRVDGRTAYVAAAGIGGKRLGWREGGTTIGLVPETSLADLDRPASAFRDRQVASFSAPDARRIVVTRGAATLTLTRPSEAGAWTGSEGSAPPVPVDGTRVVSLLDRIRSVRASAVDDGSPSTPPTGTLVVSGDAGELARVSWGPLPPAGGEETVWVTTPARAGAVFRVPASSFGPLPSRLADLAAP